MVNPYPLIVICSFILCQALISQFMLTWTIPTCYHIKKDSFLSWREGDLKMVLGASSINSLPPCGTLLYSVMWVFGILSRTAGDGLLPSILHFQNSTFCFFPIVFPYLHVSTELFNMKVLRISWDYSLWVNFYVHNINPLGLKLSHFKISTYSYQLLILFILMSAQIDTLVCTRIHRMHTHSLTCTMYM